MSLLRDCLIELGLVVVVSVSVMNLGGDLSLTYGLGVKESARALSKKDVHMEEHSHAISCTGLAFSEHWHQMLQDVINI